MRGESGFVQQHAPTLISEAHPDKGWASFHSLVPHGFAPFIGDDGKAKQQNHTKGGENGNHQGCNSHMRTPLTMLQLDATTLSGLPLPSK
jgi:hypothetical protein